jgi:hypothetical protein
MADAPYTPRAVVDSLSANEFAVELDGALVSGIFRISGLVSFRLNANPPVAPTRTEPFIITKMVQRDSSLPFNRWAREAAIFTEGSTPAQHQLDIIALDDGEEVRRWRVSGAWISEISYSDFDSASSELVQQRLVVQYESMEEVWP